MVTLRSDGTPHTARVELAVVEGRGRATGTLSLVRTRNLRHDSRCALFVFGPHPRWLGLETTATILDGPDAPRLLADLLRARHGTATPPGTVLAYDDALGHDRPWPEAEFLDHARRYGLLLYDFTVQRCYGNP